MTKRFDTNDLPREGDVVRYERSGYGTLVLPVTYVEPQGGYTDYWLGESVGRMPALFNINHTTGMANTHHSQGGRWSIVRRAEDPKPVSQAEFGETVTVEEQAFGADLYDLMSEHNLIPNSYFGKTRVIIAAIQAIRKETK